jgi:EpsI family protein
MIGRALVLVAAIGAAGVYASRATGREAAIDRRALASLPATLGVWTSSGDRPLDAESLDVLRMDDYLNRSYAAPGGRLVNFYVGYWGSQRQGDTIHSPQNCLPGSGWQPIESSRTAIAVAGRSVPATRYLIARGSARQLAYYWFQGRGRVSADEYANKSWLIVDAARLHRSNGALVRVMARVEGANGGAAADASVADFVRQVFPHLESYLP